MLVGGGARKHEVWIPGRAGVPARSLCQACYRDCTRGRARLASCFFAGIIMLRSRGYDGSDWYSIHVLLTRQFSRAIRSHLVLIGQHQLFCGASRMSARTCVMHACSRPCSHADEHKQTRSRLVRIPHRWSWPSTPGDRSRLYLSYLNMPTASLASSRVSVVSLVSMALSEPK